MRKNLLFSVKRQLYKLGWSFIGNVQYYYLDNLIGFSSQRIKIEKWTEKNKNNTGFVSWRKIDFELRSKFCSENFLFKKMLQEKKKKKSPTFFYFYLILFFISLILMMRIIDFHWLSSVWIHHHSITLWKHRCGSNEN